MRVVTARKRHIQRLRASRFTSERWLAKEIVGAFVRRAFDRAAEEALTSPIKTMTLIVQAMREAVEASTKESA